MLEGSDGAVLAGAGASAEEISEVMSRRRLKDHWNSLVSHLQPAYVHGYPEYALEVNMALAASLPRGSPEHGNVMEEVARLTRMIEAGKVPEKP